jgi:hypothetical protein
LVPSLSGVAAGFITLAGQDVLLGENGAYSACLETAASSIVTHWPSQIHEFASSLGLILERNNAIDALIAAWNNFAP